MQSFLYTHMPMVILDVVEYVRTYCILGTWFDDIFRNLGFWFYKLISSILDATEVIFDEIAKINLTEVIDLTNFEDALVIITWFVLGMAVLVAIAASVMKSNANLEYIKYTIIVITAIICFNVFNEFAVGLKNSGYDIINMVFSGGDSEMDDKTISERIFYLNTFDILTSIQDENQKLHSINMNIPVRELNINEKIDIDDLEGTIEYDEEGNMTVDYDGTKGGGFFTGDLFAVKYYRYYINFMQCIVVEFACLFVYVFSALKLMYLIVNWFFSKIYGTLAMATSVNGIEKVKMVYTSILQLLLSILLTNAGVKIFEVMVSKAIVQEWHFVTKAIFLFISGSVIILGSSNINKFFGIDDGTNFMLKSFMLTRTMNHMRKGLMRWGRKGAAALKNAKSSFQNFNRGNDFMDFEDKENPLTPKPNDPAGYLDHHSNHATGRLESKEMPETMYGSENAENTHFHRADGVDRHYANEKEQRKLADEKLADKTQRYDRGQRLQSEIEQRQNTDQSTSSSGKEKPYKQYQRGETMDYQYKSYDQYKRDFAKGDKSVHKKQATGGYAQKTKTLPEWFYQTNDNEPMRSAQDDTTLQQALRNLGKNRPITDDDSIEDMSALAEESHNAYEEFLNRKKKGD